MKKFILCILFNTGYLILFVNMADAGVIINRPLAIGLNSGLVGHWTFDGKDMVSNKTARDISGQGNNGTLTNGPKQIKGRIGQALNFDGVGDVVDVGDPASGVLDFGTGNFSVSVWARNNGYVNTGTSFNAIVAKGPCSGSAAWAIYVNSTNVVTFCVANTSTAADSAANAIKDNNWHHLVGVRSGSTLTLYIDGQLVGTDTATDDVSSVSKLGIGDDTTGIREFVGSIDDVRVYNRALSQDEIKRLYNLGGTFVVNKSQNTGTLKDGLVGHWTFDGKDMVSNKTARDISGQGNDGTLTNGPKQIKGRIGQALDFDVTGSRAVVTISPTNTFAVSTISESAWINLATTTSGSTIQKTIFDYADASGNGRTLSVRGVEIRWGDNGGTNTDTTNVGLKAGIWYHVVLTFTTKSVTNNVNIYVNGVLVLTANNTSVGQNKNLTERIGCRLSSGVFIQCLYGLIDDVRIYNRVLSPDEIKRLYNLGGTFVVNKSQSTGTLKDGLVGHWTFDGRNMATNTALDISGNNNHGVLTNGPVRTKGRLGQALEFDGVNDLVDVGTPSSLNNLGSMTVSAWIYPGSLGGGSNGRIVYNESDNALNAINGWYFGLISSPSTNNIIFSVAYSTTNLTRRGAGGDIKLNAWQHVAVSWDGSATAANAHLYVNGVEIGHSDTNAVGSRSDDSGATSPLTIGNVRTGNTPRTFDGLIDDVRIYNRVLSPDEIKRLYNMGR